MPQSDGWFLVFVAIHIVAALTALIAGASAALARKQAGDHPHRGKVYFWALGAVFVTALILSGIRWPHDTLFAVLGALAFGAAILGRLARHRHWPGWVYIHGSCMGASYILLLITFYLDNGPHLPVWAMLPHFLYWALPIAIGVPLILKALLKYRNS